MKQANRIIKQCIEKLPTGPILASDAPDLVMPPEGKGMVIGEMSLDHAFIRITEKPVTSPEGEIYVATEVPKGELGFYFVSDGTGKPYRMRVRAPSFCSCINSAEIMRGWICRRRYCKHRSIDIVLGECDR